MARTTLALLFVLAGFAVTAACGSSEGDAPATPAGADASEAGVDAPGPSSDGAVEGAGGDVTPTDPTAGDLARAAIILASCHGGGGPFGDLAAAGQEPSELLYFMQTMLFDEPLNAKVRAQLACLGTKTNGCKALEECMGATVDTQPCANAGCSGTVSERCSGTRRLLVDCARLGQRCEVSGGCVDANATPCGGGFAPSCNEQVELCRNNFTAHGPKCAVFSSLSCGTGNNGPACVGSGAACQGGVSSAGLALQVDGYFASNARCENDALVTCVGNKEASLACNKVVEGLRCQTATFGNRTLYYCGRGTQCAPGEPRTQLGGRPTCDGDDYVICNGGIHERISCKTLGFGSCNRERCEP